jgi:hypothetical protein
MEKEFKLGLIAALTNTPSANFSAEDVNTAAVNAIMKELGLDENSSPREIRAKEADAFALIEEAVDEILPKKLQAVLGEYAEVKSFARDAEVLFNIEKIGKNRAKLTISRGSRAGIYRAARLDSRYFGLETHVETVGVFCTLEEIILGTMSLGELFSNVLEGFEEAVYKEVFDALAAGVGAAGRGAIKPEATTKSALGAALDKVLPKVKQYGVPTIFGSFEALADLWNDGVSGHPELEDAKDRRQYGIIKLYKGVRVVELPNYLVDSSNEKWIYDRKYVFVLPSGAKPVKVALKGEMYIKKNTNAVGSEKWEAHKIIGVGVAMANNYAVIELNDADLQ